MSKLCIATPAFVPDNPALAASVSGADPSHLKEAMFRLGVLDNTKPNGLPLMEKIAEELSARGLVKNTVTAAKTSPKFTNAAGVEVVREANPAGVAAAPALLDRLAKETDFLITGLGN